MTHTKPIPMVITALYQNDVQFADKRIPFKIVKCITREFYGHVLSSVLSGSKLLWSIHTEQHQICSNGSF